MVSLAAKKGVLKGLDGGCARAVDQNIFLPVMLAGLPKASRSLRVAVTLSPAIMWGFWRDRREAAADGGAGLMVTALRKGPASGNEDPTN